MGRGRCKELANSEIVFHEGKRPWGLVKSVDFALPCATQNEIETGDAENLVNAGCSAVFEGANMPSTPDAIRVYKEKSVAYFPAKADNRLKGIMKSIYVTCRDTAKDLGHDGDFQLGANAAGFKKVADSMIAQGMVFNN